MYDNDWMVGWNRSTTGARSAEVEVNEWPDKAGWSRKYTSSAGCCDAGYSSRSDSEKERILKDLFIELVLGDDVDPKIVHQEFYKIKQWRNMHFEVPAGTYSPFVNGNFSPHNP